jgi:hypothetical protein
MSPLPSYNQTVGTPPANLTFTCYGGYPPYTTTVTSTNPSVINANNIIISGMTQSTKLLLVNSHPRSFGIIGVSPTFLTSFPPATSNGVATIVLNCIDSDLHTSKDYHSVVTSSSNHPTRANLIQCIS